MWTLIKRDLDQMVMTTFRSSAITHIFLGLFIVLLFWIFGPHVVGYFSVIDMSYLLLFFGMLGASTFYTLSNIEDDASNRQYAFLQLLPVRKKHIIYAKFLSNLIVCVLAFIWASVLISVNLLINGTWSLDAWLISVVFVSTLICQIAGSLLLNFILGGKRGFWYIYAMLFIWIILLYQMLGPIAESLPISFDTLSGISLGGAMAVYLICWWASAERIKRKGFPEEVSSIAREKEQSNLDDLKRRYEERKGHKL